MLNILKTQKNLNVSSKTLNAEKNIQSKKVKDEHKNIIYYPSSSKE